MEEAVGEEMWEAGWKKSGKARLASVYPANFTRTDFLLFLTLQFGEKYL
jgi:hypothetical protein